MEMSWRGRSTGGASLKEDGGKAGEVTSTGPWVTRLAGGDGWPSSSLLASAVCQLAGMGAGSIALTGG